MNAERRFPVSWPRAVRGYSLFELVIVIAGVGILAAALAPVALHQIRTHALVRSQQAAIDDLRYAVRRIARELQHATWAAGVPAIHAGCGTQGLEFTRQLGGEAAFRVSLQLQGTDLWMRAHPEGSAASEPVLLLQGVVDVRFTCEPQGWVMGTTGEPELTVMIETESVAGLRQVQSQRVELKRKVFS
jgi:type II secretory pathway pseudopilin PulG